MTHESLSRAVVRVVAIIVAVSSREQLRPPAASSSNERKEEGRGEEKKRYENTKFIITAVCILAKREGVKKRKGKKTIIVRHPGGSH